ncbi:MAG: transposase, partial [Gammaproteobacteria bacterium]|nr:transposase [Gammaproteobacteria bacterium]
MSEKECYNKLRAMRWPDGQVRCPRCSLDSIHTIVQKEIKRQYRCTDCNRHFNDLTDTLFQSSNLSLKHWMCCLYLMGLNVSNRQISLELGVSEKTAQNMTGQIRDEI